MYLIERTPNDDFDPRDGQRHLWTHIELNAFSETVEDRVQRVLECQQQTLRHWRDSAVLIQRVARGLLARRFVVQERARLLQLAAQLALERAQALDRIASSQAARAIQRSYHAHRARTNEREKARRSLQRSVRLFIFRCSRHHAALVVQRTFRWFQWRRKLLVRAKKLARRRALLLKRQQLEVAAKLFQAAQVAARQERERILWEQHGPKLQELVRVRQRQDKLPYLSRACGVASGRQLPPEKLVLPPLPRKHPLPNLPR